MPKRNWMIVLMRRRAAQQASNLVYATSEKNWKKSSSQLLIKPFRLIFRSLEEILLGTPSPKHVALVEKILGIR